MSWVRPRKRRASSNGKRPQQTNQALEDQNKKTKEGKQGFDDLAKGMGTSERAANAFKETVSRISPELGAMLNIAIKGGDILNFSF